MNFTENAYAVFEQSIADYHRQDFVDADIKNPYPDKSVESVLYLKNWIDTVQWHLEDIIREPDINPVKALEIKRRIDRSNQERTDLVEQIDEYFLTLYGNTPFAKDATLNTESPAWAIDRLSILALKIYHWQQEIVREGIDEKHKTFCQSKLNILLEQKNDLSLAISQLIDDIAAGRKQMKVYRQMKMYNDPNLNPVLYSKQK
jgi:hypothetical protein